jgi:hypothetical protein
MKYWLNFYMLNELVINASTLNISAWLVILYGTGKAVMVMQL